MLHHKLALEQIWADQVYNGRWFSPLKEALDAFMANTQQVLTGSVKLKFYKGGCVVVGRSSAASLYDAGLATYDNDDSFDQKAAKGLHRHPGPVHQDVGDQARRAGPGLAGRATPTCSTVRATLRAPMHAGRRSPRP